MKTALAFLAAAIPAACACAAATTPSDSDVPRPVPATVSLAGSPAPDISRFVQVRRATAPSLSPDGRQIAYRTDLTGAPQVWVTDPHCRGPVPITFGGAVTFHDWSPAGDWILYGTDRDGDERVGFYLVSPDGLRERELLAPSEAFRRFGDFTRDGKQIAYATTERNGLDFDIRLLDVETGADREVFRGRMGLYPVAWSPDASAVLLSEARGEDASDIHLLDVRTGRIEILFQPADAASYSSFSWTPDGRGFYLVTNQDREYAALAHYDLATRQLDLVDAPEAEVEAAALSADGRHLVWIVSVDGYSAIRARDLESGRTLTGPNLPRGIYEIRWARRAPVLAVSVFGPQLPGDVWTWNATTGETNRATWSTAAGLDLATMCVPEHVSFPGRDGVTLHGYLYRPPPGAVRAQAAVALFVHGGPTAHAEPLFDGPQQYLLSRGIAVFDFNYRGSTGYGKRFARLNDRRLRENELADLEDAVAWLGKQDGLDGQRVAILGGSYGGYLAMAALARRPDTFAAGVAFVGVSNWVTALEGASPELKASDRFEYGDIDDPADREFFRQISPLTHVTALRAPILVIHGANDPRNPVAESDQFVRAIRDQGGTVEYLRFPDEGHGLRKTPNRIIAWRRIAAFLERNLARTEPASSPPAR